MTNYIRVMSPIEADKTRNTGFVPTNFTRWAEHEAGTGVFLLEADQASWQTVAALADELIETTGIAEILSFRSGFQVEQDRSGWHGNAACIHRGPIKVSDLLSVKWRTYAAK